MLIDSKNIEIDEYDFDSPSELHGLSHTKRVMQLVQHLGLKNELPVDVINQAYCAAVIHDMARKHDYECEKHGLWAVETKLPIWKKQFLKFGLTEAQLEHVAFAVHWHCIDRRLFPNSESLPTLYLLQDADALDRVRSGGPESIRLDYLHFSNSENEISYAEKLFWNFD
jgi:HD superfamily phosphodiesterase